jgi:hypothetical protein
MAFKGGAVNQPPRWAQALLRALLEPRDRDTIAGDLLEEYRDRLAHSPAPAKAWYIRQVLSFVRGRNLQSLPFAVLPGNLAWAAAAALAQFAVVFALPVRAGIPVEWSAFILITVVLAIAALAAIGSAPSPRATCRTVFRIAGLWFLLFAILAIGTLKASAFTPVPGVILFLICVPGAAMHASARSSRIGLGTATAVTTASLIAMFAAALLSLLHYPHPPLAGLPVLPAVAAVIGAVGAMFGNRFGGLPSTGRFTLA